MKECSDLRQILRKLCEVFEEIGRFMGNFEEKNCVHWKKVIKKCIRQIRRFVLEKWEKNSRQMKKSNQK